jgi:hypothetical protein
MRATLVLFLASGCAVRAPALSAQHPASPSAESGRLAGAPPSLRPGIVDYKDVPPVRQGDDQGGGHHHHGH